MKLEQLKNKVTATAFLTVNQLAQIERYTQSNGIIDPTFFSLIESCKDNNRKLFDEINAIKETEEIYHLNLEIKILKEELSKYVMASLGHGKI